jgi:hypothetical protein
MGTCRIGDKGEIEGDLEEILEDVVWTIQGRYREIQEDPKEIQGDFEKIN